MFFSLDIQGSFELFSLNTCSNVFLQELGFVVYKEYPDAKTKVEVLVKNIENIGFHGYKTKSQP